MKTSTQTFGGILKGCALLLFAAGMIACGNYSGSDRDGVKRDIPLSYEAFKAQAFGETFHGVPTGIFIVDGDTPADGEERLQQYYEQYLNSFALNNPGNAVSRIVVGTSAGINRLWSAAEKYQLTYCISDAFALSKPQIVQAMAEATQTWKSAADIQFTYVPAEDLNCSVATTNVLFDVQLTSGQSYLARSFFPGDPRTTRSIMIDVSSFTVGWPLTLAGILRHELGHTLGLRHEHTRPEAGVCFEDVNWRVITTYDSGSVMHYPQCNGTGDWSLTLSGLDKLGISAIYGSPVP